MEIQILVVDDDEMIQTMVANYLGETGYVCHKAGNFEAAIQCAGDNPIDLALLDINLPGSSGVRLLSELKAQHPDLHAIMVTAVDDLDTATYCLSHGASDYLVKPFKMDRLMLSVKNTLEKHRLTLENREYQANLEHQVEEKTELLRKTQQIILHQEKLAAIGQLAAGVAHEINNPTSFIAANLRSLEKYLNKVLNFVMAERTLLEELPPGDTRSRLDELFRQAKLDFIVEDAKDLIKESMDGTARIQRIVQGLKGFSRSEEGDPQPADINRCIENAITIAWNEIKYKATLHRQFGPLPQILCHPQELAQVFMNLLVNSAHAIEGSGEISIRTWEEDRCLCVEVTDTGCGIPEENLEKIFEPFFTTKEAGKGTGLGMGIAREIVSRHQGEIRVKSEVGVGTTFSVILPIRTDYSG